MGEHRRYFRSIAATSLGNTLASALAAGILLPAIIRRVGLEDYGLWALLGLFISASSLLDLGVYRAVVILVARRPVATARVAGSALLLTSGVAVVAGAVLWMGLAHGWPVFGALGRAHPAIIPWASVAGTCIVLATLATNVLRGILEARLRGDLVNVGFAALTVCQYALLAILAWAGAGVRWLMVASAAVYVLVLLLHLGQLLALRALPMPRAKPSGLREVLVAGWHSCICDLAVNLLVPIVLYAFVLEAGNGAEYGILDLSVRICSLAASALGALAVPFLALSAADQDQRGARTRAMVLRFVRVTLLLAALGVGTYWAVGETLVSWVFGPTTRPVWHASLLMLSGAALSAAMEPVARWLLGTGRIAHLVGARYAAVCVAALGLVLPLPGPALDRYAIALGCGHLACASWLAFSLLRAGRKPAARSDPAAAG